MLFDRDFFLFDRDFLSLGAIRQLIGLGCNAKFSPKGTAKGGGAVVAHRGRHHGHRPFLLEQSAGGFHPLLGQVAKHGGIQHLAKALFEFAIVNAHLSR